MNLKNLLPVALLALSPLPEVAAESGFADTCNSWGIGWSTQANSYYINANCREPSGIFNVATAIYLNACFANQNGHLRPVPKGGFSGSCRNVRMQGTFMHADCNNGSGGWQATYIDVNRHVGNINGSMKCHNGLGAPY